jgi:hypothetical protein
MATDSNVRSVGVDSLLPPGTQRPPRIRFVAVPSFFNPIRALCYGSASPRHDRYRRGRVLRRPFDDPVAINHVHEDISFHVATANDLHFLEEERAAFSKHILALLKFRFEGDRTYLAAGQGDIRYFLGYANPPLKSASFRHRKMASDAINFRVIEAIGRQLVVGRQPFEYSRSLEDQIGLFRAVCSGHRRQRRDNQRNRKTDNLAKIQKRPRS